MPAHSHLTRHVFRRILANEPIIHRGCLRRQACASYATTTDSKSPYIRRRAPNHHVHQQRRTLFNFNMFGPQKRQVKEADRDPGIEELMHLAKMQRMKARLPPAKDIAEALDSYVKAKYKSKGMISDTDARLLAIGLRYCMEVDTEAKQYQEAPGKGLVTSTVFRYLASSLDTTSEQSKVTEAHLDLTALLLRATRYRKTATYSRGAIAYAAVLGCLGQSIKARDFAVELGKYAVSSDEEPKGETANETEGPLMEMADGDESLHGPIRRYDLLGVWSRVLHGFAKEDDEPQLLASLDTFQNQECFADPKGANWRASTPMLAFYLRRNDAKGVKTWFDYMWDYQEQNKGNLGSVIVESSLHSVLRWCLTNGELDYGQEVVRRAMAGNPPKKVWDAIFIWAAGNGKGADEINRMLDVMEKSNEEISNPNNWRLPDIATINGLVEYATSKADPYMAERFIALGRDRGIEPDAKTYQLQVDYRLKVQDVDGALLAYKSLQAMDLSSNEDIPTVNHLIVALCRTKRHDFETVMNVAMDLSDRRARFEPETVATLALLHLSRDEYHDVVDLLNTHAYHFSSEERNGIRDQILTFCLDPKTPTTRSWDAYNVLRTTFDEMPRKQRTDILTNFFKRERPDMAVHVFTEMRRHSRTDAVPTVDTYVASFLGSAKLRDLQSLEVIHNQLKLDYTIDLNTYIRNAMMIAYTACERPRQALGFWEDIVASKEGPTYNSIHIALRACEKAPFGDRRAQSIWAKLRKMKVDLDQNMWASYAAALVGNGDIELAITTLEEAEGKSELEMDVFLLGSLMNGATNEAKQAEVETWATTNYPGVWEELQKVGFEENDVGKKSFKLDRSVTP